MSLRPHICILTKTTRWEVVENSASPKRPFFFISCHFSHFQSISSPNPRQTYLSYIFLPQISLFLKTTPTSNPKGGAHSTCMFIFLLGHSHIWPKGGGGGGGGMRLKSPPPPRSTYAHICTSELICLTKKMSESRQIQSGRKKSVCILALKKLDIIPEIQQVT